MSKIKIKRLIILLFISSFVLLTASVFKHIHSGYRITKSASLQNYSYLLSDSVLQKGKLIATLKNKYNDSISLINYNEKYKLFIWKIEEFELKKNNLIILEKQNLMPMEKKKSLVSYHVTFNPFFYINTKLKLDRENPIHIDLYVKKIFAKKKGPNFLYYCLQLNGIRVKSNDKNEFQICPNYSIGADLIIYSLNKKLYFLLLVRNNKEEHTLHVYPPYSIIREHRV